MTRRAAPPVEGEPDVATAVAAADRLEQAGDHLGAARLLEALPRHRRDPSLDVRVVRLRHRAVADLPPTHERPEEAAPPDLWPGTLGTPAVAAADLSLDRLRSALWHHGSLIVRGLLSHPTCDRLRQDIDRAFEAFDRHREAAPSPGPQAEEWYAPLEVAAPYEAPDPVGTFFLREGGGVYAPHAPRAFVDYRNDLQQVGLLGLVAEHLQAMPVLSVNKSVLRRIGGGASPAWHQDGIYLGDTGRSLNLWLALSECGGDTDVMGLEVVPGGRTGLAETGTFDALDRRAIPERVAEQLAAEGGRPVERPLFHPGDGILFDQYFVHRSDPRPLPRERYAVECWFFTPHGFPAHLVPLVAG